MRLFLPIAASCALLGCHVGGEAPLDAGTDAGVDAGIDAGTSAPQTFAFSFDGGAQGWTARFADYPPGAETFYELDAGWQPLTAPLVGNGLAVSGNNHSDTLFMYAERKVHGLQSMRTYRVDAEVEFATHAGTSCTGVGGAPGESVYVKLGAADHAPLRTVVGANYQVDISKGDQALEGTAMTNAGDLANGSLDCSGSTWRLKTATKPIATRVKAAADGSVWLLFGTDSGFEGRTTVIYTRARFTLVPE